ncbi:N-acetylglucosaminyldiphosphodolichol N-acetylglucosaminyltransferase catalytic subunit alg13 [Coemansia spiralis]|uniref:UDP-N-acetylglucosamine transferase subunit ALG13 n=2 Tax=Coemansia TaxID=4863 RepID=A0A9W8GEF1_9FUNG|nr:N-acetylglucosaminyldiphosphodolichol N-acetylglucosaminyltransferase Alg13 [Coemansia spiralis]KAJ1996365.1 N-acetylglucosaminyldiphosphodolichol N-acetylglucosaminyltransferase catalytic subunit alg13 [Coemansia umbellata]KAJ2624171.1 N-acetylglucosaminyldiphosphodolichol N-acetylglucosaminyltransferase catalytic subunit alg13 [Coemansia sp. RSA 1358]KAJ2680793.1 N-acetylglucosaminyldiphosphodolichol N-acetylglucosaminyltransferase catalytic subunit alg13 [Coemansia spiralis]
MSVYVTVGSTGFEELIEAVSSRELLQALASRGFWRLIVQYGSSGEVFGLPDTASTELGITVEAFDYTSRPQQLVDQADLVISHAGAGSILEALHSNKPLIVVVNKRLMNNHQSEIAIELAKGGYLAVAAPAELAEAVSRGVFTKLSPYPHADPRPIGEIIDEETLL